MDPNEETFVIIIYLAIAVLALICGLIIYTIYRWGKKGG